MIKPPRGWAAAKFGLLKASCLSMHSMGSTSGSADLCMERFYIVWHIHKPQCLQQSIDDTGVPSGRSKKNLW